MQLAGKKPGAVFEVCSRHGVDHFEVPGVWRAPDKPQGNREQVTQEQFKISSILGKQLRRYSAHRGNNQMSARLAKRGETDDQRASQEIEKCNQYWSGSASGP